MELRRVAGDEGPRNVRRAVLDMKDRRPVWAMPAWVPERIRRALGAGWDLFIADAENDGSGDGAARLDSAVLEAVRDAEIYFGYGVPSELLRAGPRLRWVHSGAAGVGSSLTAEMREREVVFTNSAGIHGPPIAETVLAMILYFGRGLDIAVAQQSVGTWSAERFYGADSPMREMSELTVGILGFGGIGRGVAQRVAALGARVIAAKRSPPTATEVDSLGGGGRERLAPETDIRFGSGALESVLAESDVVVACLPDTDDTRGLLGRDLLGRMKEGALFINVGRGRLVDQAALVDLLESGRLRGAGLDVFAREPLPEDDPLWVLPNVVLTPHVSAVTRGFWERETGLIERNLGRYLSGTPEAAWENVVDKAAGY